MTSPDLRRLALASGILPEAPKPQTPKSEMAPAPELREPKPQLQN